MAVIVKSSGGGSLKVNGFTRPAIAEGAISAGDFIHYTNPGYAQPNPHNIVSKTVLFDSSLDEDYGCIYLDEKNFIAYKRRGSELFLTTYSISNNIVRRTSSQNARISNFNIKSMQVCLLARLSVSEYHIGIFFEGYRSPSASTNVYLGLYAMTFSLDTSSNRYDKRLSLSLLESDLSNKSYSIVGDRLFIKVENTGELKYREYTPDIPEFSDSTIISYNIINAYGTVTTGASVAYNITGMLDYSSTTTVRYIDRSTIMFLYNTTDLLIRVQFLCYTNSTWYLSSEISISTVNSSTKNVLVYSDYVIYYKEKAGTEIGNDIRDYVVCKLTKDSKTGAIVSLGWKYQKFGAHQDACTVFTPLENNLMMRKRTEHDGTLYESIVRISDTAISAVVESTKVDNFDSIDKLLSSDKSGEYAATLQDTQFIIWDYSSEGLANTYEICISGVAASSGDIGEEILVYLPYIESPVIPTHRYVKDGEAYKLTEDAKLYVDHYNLPSLYQRTFNPEDGVILSDIWTSTPYDSNYPNDPNSTFYQNMVYYEDLIKILNGGYEGNVICTGHSDVINSYDKEFDKPRRLYLRCNNDNYEALIERVVVNTQSQYIKFYGSWVGSKPGRSSINRHSSSEFWTDNVYHNRSDLYNAPATHTRSNNGYGKIIEVIQEMASFKKGTILKRTVSNGWIEVL